MILLDADPELVKAIQIRLEIDGHETLVGHDGMEGLDKARKEKPDLIVLDLMLPKIIVGRAGNLGFLYSPACPACRRQAQAGSSEYLGLTPNS